MKKKISSITFYGFLVLATFGFRSLLFAQHLAGTEGTIEPRYLIDKPTAGLMKRGSFGIGVDFFQQGGVLMMLNAGVMDRLHFGISYGGNDIIGSNVVEWNKSPGVNVKFRLFDEEGSFPAVALGFDSQGKENYKDSLERYNVKSLGFYAVGSKNIEFLGFLSTHLGINRSLENRDDKDLNIFFGVEKTVGADMSILAECDLAYNDDINSNDNRKYNLGMRWSIGDGVLLGANLKSITWNNKTFTIGNRTILVEYVKIF
ncbi:MAG: YjbH domain-containing protein [Ignavibacteriales bacterium]|nr:YjbH domain-containing protein [Ignavibacteriales bacterium]